MSRRKRRNTSSRYIKEASDNEPDQGRRRFLEMAALGALASGAPLSAKEANAAPPPAGWPMTDKWFPSRWGVGDQAGASNWMSPQKVLEAVTLIKSGKVHSLGRVYEAGMPFFGTRGWNLKIPSAPFYGPAGRNKLIANEEYLCAEIGQVGTQFDGLSHIGVETKGPHDNSGKLYYNGFNGTEVHGAFGMKKLGVEHAKPFVTRAVIFDVKGLKGRNLERGEECACAPATQRIGFQGRRCRAGALRLGRSVDGRGKQEVLRWGTGCRARCLSVAHR
jgi:hypothetical protein